MKVLTTFVKQAFPASFNCLFGYLTEAINMIMIGHLNDPYKLAGVGLGNIIVNMFGIGPYFGLNSALETLVC
jgi:Na+-driven multidrug efflux pump